MSGLKYVVSADSHIMEPFDLWTRTLGEKHGEKLPQVVEEYRGEKTRFYFTGFEYIKIGDFEPVDTADSQAGSKSLEEELLAKVDRTNEDPDLRLELMDHDGVSAEIVNPTYLLYTLRTPDAELVKDCCAVYNDYIADYVSTNPRRMLGTSMIDMEDVDWAVAELERTRKRNLRTTIINTDVRDGMPPYRDKSYDRFWAAAQDLDVPVTLHIITGKEQDPYTLQGSEERQIIAQTLIRVLSDVGPVLANEFIFGGIFDRFPKLQIILGEYEISWLPWYMFRCRQLEGALGQSMDMVPPKRSVDEVMYNNVWHGVVDDEYFDRAYDVAGPTRIMWGSDFPHPRNTFPNTHAVLDRVFANVPEQVKIDVAGMNCARLFDLEVPTEAAVAAE